MARPHIELGDGQWHLWRLADNEFGTLAQHALPIDQNFALSLALKRRAQQSGFRSPLGAAFVELEREFGPSSPLFDGLRTSFSFPLLLTFERERRISYLLRCHDHRGELHFPMYRIVSGDPSVLERSVSYPPDCEEFSREAMDQFISELHAHLLGCHGRPAAALVATFYRAIPSDLLLYGYDGSDFFENGHESAADFDRVRLELDVRFGLGRARSLSNRVERLIDRVTETPGGGSPLTASLGGGGTSLTAVSPSAGRRAEKPCGGIPTTETQDGGT